MLTFGELQINQDRLFDSATNECPAGSCEHVFTVIHFCNISTGENQTSRS